MADISILALNLSLMINTVSFYQVGNGVQGLSTVGGGDGGKQERPCSCPIPHRMISFGTTHSILTSRLNLAQIAKLLIIPFVCFVEWFYMGRTFTREVATTILVVIIGVAIV